MNRVFKRSLAGVAALALVVGGIGYMKQKRKLKALEAKEQAEGVCAAPSSTAQD